MKKIKDKNIFVVMGLCLLIATLSFAYFLYQDGGAFALRDDFNRQQIPFATVANGLLKNYSGQWCWNLDLGTQMIGGFGFYNLGSPFFWISLLFDKGIFPYVVGPIFIMKYMVAGLTSYLYIRIFVKDKRYAIVGALLYTFSGFQNINLVFYHFHDVVALFPLLLLGAEEFWNKNKKTLFIFSIFLNCLVNYFFFIGEVIFLILYYFFRFFSKADWRNSIKRGFGCLGCGIVGVGMAAVLFLPSILYILGNPRSESVLYLSTLFYNTRDILLIIKGFLFPVEAMGNQSAVIAGNWNSIACYLPMVGISLSLAYVIKKRDWLSKILIVLCAISFLPLIESAFYMFTHVYNRWWYMLVLMASIASSIVLERQNEYPIKRGLISNAAILIVFCGSLKYMKWSSDTESLIYRNKIFLLNFVISLVGIIIVYLLLKKKKRMVESFIVALSCFSFITMFSAVYLYRQDSQVGKDYLQQYNLGLQLKNLDDQYRYNLSDNQLVLPGDAMGVGSFTSTVSNSTIEFNELFGNNRVIFSIDPNSITGMKELLGARYRLNDTVENGKEIVDVVSSYGKDYYITEEKVCPIGFSYSSYVLEDELKAIEDTNVRGIVALGNLIVSQSDESQVAGILSHTTEAGYNPDVNALTDINIKNKVNNFSRDNGGFACTTDYDSDVVVFFSVPYDDGWSAYIDGKEASIIKTAGMMSLVIPEGVHEIQFKYFTPGLKAGFLLTVISFVTFLSIFFYDRRKNRRISKSPNIKCGNLTA